MAGLFSDIQSGGAGLKKIDVQEQPPPPAGGLSGLLAGIKTGGANLKKVDMKEVENEQARLKKEEQAQMGGLGGAFAAITARRGDLQASSDDDSDDSDEDWSDDPDTSDSEEEE